MAGLDVHQHCAGGMPFRRAKSSMPSTSGVPPGGSGAARMSRSSVDRLTARASLPFTRAPARPPRALAIAICADAREAWEFECICTRATGYGQQRTCRMLLRVGVPRGVRGSCHDPRRFWTGLRRLRPAFESV
jgi:hypothetical protein